MKEVPDRTGRFFTRPHYQPAELDRECERVLDGFFKPLYGEIRFPISTDDLTKLIERDTSDFDGYADLSRFGDDVEGLTEFLPGKKPRVRIAEGLASDERRENRYRTTLTHEYGHVRFHAYLFELERPRRDLDAGARERDRLQVCKRQTILSAGETDWMEWQAGHVCGALLMPATALKHLVREYQEQYGLFGPVEPSSAHGATLIRAVTAKFQVSADAARVRLSRLQVLGPSQGPSLFSR